MSEFKKFDNGKAKLSWVPLSAIEGISKVMEMGAAKYGKDNWRTCTDMSRYLDALLRHTYAYVNGEHYDKESGFSHMDHVLCNAAFIKELTKEVNDESV